MSVDVSDLQNFVNIALATAAGGEDDLAHDKLSNLRTVGSGFGALIYKLPKEASYAELARCCEFLWGEVENDKDLPEKLVRMVRFLKQKIHISISLRFETCTCKAKVKQIYC